MTHISGSPPETQAPLPANAWAAAILRVLATFSVLATLVIGTGGCIGSSETVYVPTGPGYGESIEALAAEFFASEVAQRMRSDAALLLPEFGGIPVFSTAQYGSRFITGSIDIGDVFDARVPGNMAAFLTYASNTRLIDTDPNALNYNRYSAAANRFLAAYGYDAVLFHPDEIHPLFTKTTDTWLYVREQPDGVSGTAIGTRKLYYSGRITRRRIEIAGGLKMQVVNGNHTGMVYLPIPGEAYSPYAATLTTEIATSTPGARLNVSAPVMATPAQIALRREAGIADSPLSNRRGLRVGGWKSETYAGDLLHTGLSFFDSPDQYTWGQTGHYLLPLDTAFWR